MMTPTLPNPTEPLPALSPERPLHFVGIGGIGMSGLARIALQQGFQVSGSDPKGNRQTDWLAQHGATIYKGHSAHQVPQGACVVLSSAIQANNPEWQVAREHQWPILHRSDLLKHILQHPQFCHMATLGVSGSHGKTSTTGMLGQLLAAYALSPTVIAGGEIPAWQTNACLGETYPLFPDSSITGRVAVAELDESDGTLVKYQPTHLIILNVELDHADHYTDGLAGLLATFRQTIQGMANTPSDHTVFSRTVIANATCPNTVPLAFEALKLGLTVLWFGMDTPLESARAQWANWVPDAETILTQASERWAYLAGQSHGRNHQGYPLMTAHWSNCPETLWGQRTAIILSETNAALATPVPLGVYGEHFIGSALASIAALCSVAGRFTNVAFDQIPQGLASFTGMGKRFERVSNAKGAIWIDDYAHHPTEIEATLATARACMDASKTQYPNAKLWVCLQAHRYSRLAAFFDRFAASVALADEIIVMPVYAAGEPEKPEATHTALTQAMQHQFPSKAITAWSADEVSPWPALQQHLLANVQPGDWVLGLGAGDITYAFRSLPQ